MIQHIVMQQLRADHDPAELAAVMQGLGALSGEIAGFDGFTHGPNRDFEELSKPYDYGFICTFTDADALALYADDPRHKALGGRLVDLCAGGVSGLMVIDLDVSG